MVLTVSFVFSPETGLFCLRRLRGVKGPSGISSPSANLISASGYQDRTTLPSARWRVRQPRISRPPHPALNVRDDRETPLERGGTLGDIDLIWVCDEAKFFCKRGWTRFLKNCPSGKSAQPSRFSACARIVNVGELHHHPTGRGAAKTGQPVQPLVKVSCKSPTAHWMSALRQNAEVV